MAPAALRVPTWVVAQLNKLVLDEPIGSGKDIVVPRMVFAPATASLPKTPVASADRTIRR